MTCCAAMHSSNYEKVIRCHLPTMTFKIDWLAAARRFRRNFREVAWVKAPKIYWGRTTAKVLTMEYLPGIKISAAAALRSAGIDTALVAGRATEAYLMQVLRHSFLHSDPHPGNVMVDADGEPA